MPDHLDGRPGSPPTLPPLRARSVGPGSVLLILLLVAGAFVQARLLYPVFFLPRRYDAERVADVNLPARTLRILASEGDPRLVLKTPLDDQRANESDRAELDRQLFPGALPHSYVLLVARTDAPGGATLDLGKEALLLEGAGGRTFAPVDLFGALTSRGKALPAYLDLSLKNLVPAPGPIAIAQGASRHLLLAYAAEADLSEIRSARLGDRVLAPVEVRKDDLDREVSGGAPAAERR